MAEVWMGWVVVAGVGGGPLGLRVGPLAQLAEVPLRGEGVVAEGTWHPVTLVGAEGELWLVIELFWSGLVALR